MANRKPKARNADMRMEIYSSLQAAENLDRSGLLDVQNLQNDLTGLQGLEALDAGQQFDDLTLIEQPCFIVIRRNKGYQAPQAVRVQTRSLKPAGSEPEAGPSSEQIPF